ncbi:MAG: Antibiotic biosynthesis monooxygenase [Methanobacterium sp. PtaU1.Bin097]|jgi:quinol monooxygenase YgiN|nr:MAG: Antibiotic biosynthesis monooxygenase [Methanobacterium sp. PtaU1.Bin097]
MIMVTAKMTAKPGERNNIILKAKDLIESSRSESGCISYNLYTSTEDDDVLMMLEQWKNQDVLDSHLKTEHFKAFGAAVEDILARELDINVYSVDQIND